MATNEKEEKQVCDNCGSKWTIAFDPDQCDSDPEVCPFCGAATGVDTSREDEYDDREEDEYDESDEN